MATSGAINKFEKGMWLEGFAYGININWWVFAIAILIMISTAFITISFQSIKAAIANPVKSLRTE